MGHEVAEYEQDDDPAMEYILVAQTLQLLRPLELSAYVPGCEGVGIEERVGEQTERRRQDKTRQDKTRQDKTRQASEDVESSP